MNYKVVDTINDVSRYEVREDYLFISGESDFIVYDGLSLIFDKELGAPMQYLKSNKDYCLLAFASSYKMGVYDIQENHLNLIEDVLILDFDFLSKTFYGNRSNGFGKYNLDGTELIWTLNFRLFNFFQTKDFILGSRAMDQHTLLCYSKVTGEKVWTCSFLNLGRYLNHRGLEQKYKIVLIIGEQDDIIYVLSNNGLIVALDVNTGEVIQKISNGLHVIPYNYFLDSKAKKITGFTDFTYVDIDLSTFKMSYQNLKETLANHDLKGIMDRAKIQTNETHFFVTAMQAMKYHVDDFRSADFILAINKENIKIDWQFSLESFIMENPTVSGDQLFQRTTDNKLLIFRNK